MKRFVNAAKRMNSIKVVEVRMNGMQVGRLALTPEGLCAFEYSMEFFSHGFSISPFELPLRTGVMIAKPRPFNGGLSSGWLGGFGPRPLFAETGDKSAEADIAGSFVVGRK